MGNYFRLKLMTDTTKKLSLTNLREQLDEIDDKIHQLLMDRTLVTDQVAEYKKNMPTKIRPAREAEILYRLTANHKGNFPKDGLARIWREIIGSTLRTEGPFSMSAYGTDTIHGYIEIARDQFGSFTPLTKSGSTRTIVDAVRTTEATLGILPLPQSDDEEYWWRLLVSSAPGTPKIIARLPFISDGKPRADGLEALVISPVPQEKTGRDRSYLVIEADGEISFKTIERSLSQAGVSVAFYQVWHDPDRPATWHHFIETFGYVEDGGRQIGRFYDALGARVKRILHLGGYATPLGFEDINNS